MASTILDLIEKANASLGRNAQEEAKKKRGQQASAAEKTAASNKAYASLLTASRLPISDLTAQNARMRPISKTGNQTVDFFVNSHVNLSPMELLRKDIATGQTAQTKTDRAKLFGANASQTNAKNLRQKNEREREERESERKKQPLSIYDLRQLNPGSRSLVQSAKADYDRAKAAGDKAGMESAHERAEAIRRQFGYSGGETGGRYIAPELTSSEKILLTREGEQQLRKARMDNDAAREAEILENPGFRQYTNYAENQKDRERILSGAKAAGTGIAGSLLSLSETARQAMRNYNQDRWGSNAKAAADALPLWKARLEMMQEGRGVDAWGTEEEIQERIKQGEAALASQNTRRTVDPNLPGQKLLRASQQYAQEATAGTEGLSRFLANTAISGAQMLPAIAASFIPGAGPAVGAGIMGAQAAGAKAYEVNESGAEAGEAMTRGLLSGGIEGLTERMGIGNLVNLVTRSGGASFLKNVAKQAGIEATEESASYVLNLAADVAAKDPNAQFSLAELAQNAAAGALLGGAFAGGGTAINRAITGPVQTQQAEPDNPLLRASGFYDRQAETPVQGQERSETNSGEAEEEFDLANIPRDAINKRKYEPGGWGEYYQNTAEMLFDHLREVNPELSSVVDAEADSQSGPFPAINAVVAASQDVRQDQVTPAAAIRFLSDTYKNGGVAGLEALYSPNTGNLTPESLEAMKRYEATEFVQTKNADSGTQALNAQGPENTSETSLASSLSGDPIVAESTENSNPEFEAMGAASEGFDPYTNAMNKYGTIEPGENPARMVDVPLSTDGENRVRRWARTAMEAEVTTEETIKNLERDIVNNGFSYRPRKDKQSLEKAIGVIENYGIDPALAQWQEVVDGRRSAEKDDIVLAETLYINAERTGDTELASRLAAEIAAEGTRMGQGVQALRLLKKATKEGRVYYIRKSVEYVKQELQGRMGDRAKDISISDELIQNYMDAQGKAAEDDALDAIYTHVAEQIPPTLNDRITAWRYFAMLGNPRTHIKNVIGNVLFGGVNRASNKVSSLLQRALIPEEERTRSVLAKAEAKEFAKRDFEEMKSSLGGDKYDSAYTEIQRKVQDRSLGIFSPAARFSSNAMTAEDLWAKKSQYIRSMAEIITARGWDANNLTPEQLETARTQAVKDAQKVTFQEASDLAKTLTKLEQKGPAWNLVIGGIMPFKGVPINIAKQGWRLSPAGLLDSLAFDFRRVKRGDLTATEAIDRISQGLTGTSIAAIGMFIASQGILISGEGEDERESLVNMAQGSQEYSLRIGDYTYTIDWAAPAALPMFMGAEFYNTLFSETERDEDVGALEAAFESGLRLFEPMMNMTVLSGLSDTIESASFSQGNKIAAIGTNTLENFAGQFVPTLLGQVARTFGDDTRRSTYIDRSSVVPDSVQEFGQRQANKIPGLSQKNVPYLNVWGEEDKTENVLLRAFENFISPGYIAKYEESEVADELKRLNRAGYDNVLLNTLDKYHKVDLDGDKTQERLDRNQWESWQRTQGQTAKSILTDAINSSEYQAMSDTEKADYVSTILNYAKAEGKLAAGGTADTVDSWITKTDDLESKTGIGVSALLEARSKAKAYKGGDSTQDAANYIDFVSYLANKGYSEEQMDAVSETYYEPSERAQGYADAVQSGKVSGDLMKAFLSHAVSYNEDGEGALTQKEVATALRDMEDISNADRLAIYNAHGWKTSYYDALRKK